MVEYTNFVNDLPDESSTDDETQNGGIYATNELGTPKLLKEDLTDEPPQKSAKASEIKLNKYIQGCRHVDEYEILNRIEEGSYGIVYKAQERKTSNFLDIFSKNFILHIKILNFIHFVMCSSCCLIYLIYLKPYYL